jgi:DNA-damage-inducible protein J
MSEDTIVRAEIEIDSDVRDRAESVLRDAGMTIPDLLRAAIARTAEDGAVPYLLQPEDPAYDAWFRAEIEEALRDESRGTPAEEVEAEFARKRASLIAKLGGNWV